MDCVEFISLIVCTPVYAFVLQVRIASIEIENYCSIYQQFRGNDQTAQIKSNMK